MLTQIVISEYDNITKGVTSINLKPTYIYTVAVQLMTKCVLDNEQNLTTVSMCKQIGSFFYSCPDRMIGNLKNSISFLYSTYIS